MKVIKYLFGCAIALAVIGCTDKEKTETEYDEAYYAEHATVSSSDSAFTSSNDGGAILFQTAGGKVVVNVGCGTEWAASYLGLYWIEADVDCNVGTLTVTAEQNTDEEQRTGTITLAPAESGIEIATISITQNSYTAPTITVESTDWTAPAAGELTTVIPVEASAEWTAETSVTWLSAENSGSGVTITAAENTDTEEREGKVTLSCTDGIQTATATITVTQDAHAYISPSAESIKFSYDGSSSTITVDSNYDWSYSYDTENGWFSVECSDESLTATAVANDSGSSREGTITLTAGDGAANVAAAVISVSQGIDEALVFTITISTSSTQAQLPLSGTVDCTVDWGDGSDSETVNDVLPTHIYSAVGEYTVRVDGTVTALTGQNLSTAAQPLITAVNQWGNTGLTSMSYAFYKCTKLKSIPEVTGEAFANVTTFEYAFWQCTSLSAIPADIFAKSSKATSFCNTFSCTAIAEIPSGLFDKCPDVTNFSGTFDSCGSIESIPSGLFDKCTKVTDFSSIFEFLDALSSIPDGLFKNCTEVTTFETVFNGTPIKEIPVDLFASCAKVTNFEAAFMDTRITTIPAGLFANNSAAETFALTFNACPQLVTIPEGLFDNCPEVTSFEGTFWFDEPNDNLNPIPVNLFDNNNKVTNFSFTFNNCSGSTAESPYTMVNGVKVHLYERSPENGFVAPTDYEECFYNCENMSDYSDIPSDWK